MFHRAIRQRKPLRLQQVPLLGRPASELSAAPAELLTLTAVLVRGLQGSGKSTLCRALAHLTQGEWINQDEVAAGPRVLGPGSLPILFNGGRMRQGTKDIMRLYARTYFCIVYKLRVYSYTQIILLIHLHTGNQSHIMFSTQTFPFVFFPDVRGYSWLGWFSSRSQAWQQREGAVSKGCIHSCWTAQRLEPMS